MYLPFKSRCLRIWGQLTVSLIDDTYKTFPQTDEQFYNEKLMDNNIIIADEYQNKHKMA